MYQHSILLLICRICAFPHIYGICTLLYTSVMRHPFPHIYDVMTSPYTSLIVTCAGTLWFERLLSQCNNCRTKKEYKRSHYLLAKLLLLPAIKKAIGMKCINAMFTLKNNLLEKQEKYAGFIRYYINNSMSAMTTFPRECHNRVVKYGPNAVDVKFNLNKVLQKVITNALKNFVAIFSGPNVSWHKTILHLGQPKGWPYPQRSGNGW